MAFANKLAFPPLIDTVKLKPNVEPFKSGVELSVNEVFVPSQTHITTPALYCPPIPLIRYSKCALEPEITFTDATITPVEEIEFVVCV